MMSLIAKLRQWARLLDGIDDPHGEYLLSLDHRIQQLEDARRDQPCNRSDAARRP